MIFLIRTVIAIATVAFAVAASATELHPIVVSYPHQTPESVLTQAKQAIEAAGGVITHEYDLIRGFAAKAPNEALEMVKAWGEQYDADVEYDQIISINQEGRP
ncbi:MAG: hypothetical protein M1817_004485 [Caeruleum heppii]|nr:MAG: hypothetical protein M1817_004485 [Caeruleum heppii]